MFDRKLGQERLLVGIGGNMGSGKSTVASELKRYGAKIIDADEPMAIKMQVTSGLVTMDKMKAAVNEGFENSTGGNVAPMKAKIDAFTAVFKDIASGIIYDFIYVPGKGVEIYKNGQMSATIQGLDFKKAMFGIWLCDKPAQESLKEAMLGE